MTLPLFDADSPPRTEPLAPGAVVLRAFAREQAPALLADLRQVVAQAPWRHLVTPGGYRMSVAMTNCGALGWVSDERGYRYDPADPESGRPWPAMPAPLATLAREAAASAGFEGFVPDACLINRYDAGARLSLHQDKDERDMRAPIVSVSLGVPAVFLFGGARRADPVRRIELRHGDVVVWGGPARLSYHGVAPVKAATHPLLGEQRINLTLRRAG
ncbi:DNA oxidative demethylase AlkB [Piscinibacter sp. XHJ-5]|uniref:DNA oxidative demethylase AlkB n=1 Tax=Piscinibacter sp. XHJ-5 TaxID=3037797 RepID=UPI0024530768|nr:DNA oxidative demethylase AlkB [Piscinibacter sp. XHJ-5]